MYSYSLSRYYFLYLQNEGVGRNDLDADSVKSVNHRSQEVVESFCGH